MSQSLGRLLDAKQVAQRLGIGTATLSRLIVRGDAPPRIKISEYRFGFPEALLERWLLNRLEKPLTSQPAE